jgi:hypothetical protein
MYIVYFCFIETVLHSFFIVFTATFKNISVLLVEETGVWEKTTDLSQVPCKRCIENTFLERDFNLSLMD